MKTSYMTSSKVLKRPDKEPKITQTRKMSADDEEKRGRVTELGAIIPDEVGYLNNYSKVELCFRFQLIKRFLINFKHLSVLLRY